MKKIKSIMLSLIVVALILPMDLFSQVYKFSGGPSGGTYQYFASAISTIAKKNDIRVLAASSGGSVENIRTCNNGKSSFGVAYSGNVYDALNGRLNQDSNKYLDVRVVGFFYGAPGQLIVKKNSGIKSLKDLEGKRVGVGNAGSGAAANAELMFKYLGLWDKIKPEHLGYRGAADAFKNGQLDAFWVFAGFPNASVLEVALQEDIQLLNLWNELETAGFFKENPYFQKIVIPANTYSGQETAVNSFQDAALWIANKDVPDDVVYNLLKAIYSPEGLTAMVEVHKSAKQMSISGGLTGVVTPLHSGATKFWKEKGVIK
ncbi:MAG: C4-dicarboxylate ABC transporter substrate-binding protein [Ignavibacteriales bacterium CG18_big_fil_WC_8_21_14_2_50_31_20]|nr:MAG: C4-dicarboxylate ABC transporter substrate-binding protein [Ignavibacteriales bacterium CG18_big_fil_WC_8_21_14_2_50_31_20]